MPPEVVVTVTFPVRAAPVLAVADNVTERVPEPVAGLIVSQLESDVACQVTSVVMKRKAEVALAVGTPQADNDKDNAAMEVEVPGWLTVTVRDTTPPEVVVTVTVADLDEVAMLAVACKLTDPLPEPDDGLTLSHDAFDEALQVVLDVTDTEVEPELAETSDQVEVDSVSADVPPEPPGWFTATV